MLNFTQISKNTFNDRNIPLLFRCTAHTGETRMCTAYYKTGGIYEKIIIAIIVAVLVLSLLGVYYLVKKEYVEEETIKSSKAEDLINQINIGDTYEKVCSTLGVIGVEDRRMSSFWYIFEFEDKSAIHVLFTRPRINSEINEFIVSGYRIENN